MDAINLFPQIYGLRSIGRGRYSEESQSVYFNRTVKWQKTSGMPWVKIMSAICLGSYEPIVVEVAIKDDLSEIAKWNFEPLNGTILIQYGYFDNHGSHLVYWVYFKYEDGEIYTPV